MIKKNKILMVAIVILIMISVFSSCQTKVDQVQCYLLEPMTTQSEAIDFCIENNGWNSIVYYPYYLMRLSGGEWVNIKLPINIYREGAFILDGKSKIDISIPLVGQDFDALDKGRYLLMVDCVIGSQNTCVVFDFWITE